MTVTVIVVSAVFLVYCEVCQAFYSLECPERPHWKMRARAESQCNGIADQYHCLYDQNNENITEFCARPKDYTAGFMAVYRGNIDADMCPDDRYMPFNFKSNMTEICIFLKSKCNSEGQLVHHNWSLAEDVACMCDFSNGYAYIQKPKNNCFCVPSLEDCSCYKKTCKDGNYILSPDYGCIVTKLVKTQPSDSHNFQCHPYQGRIKSQTNDRTLSISPLSSAVSSCIRKVQFKVVSDRSNFVKIGSVITMITIALAFSFILTLLVFEDFLHKDGEKNRNNTLNDIRQMVEPRRENPTELPKKSVDGNLNANDYFSINCENSSIFQFYDGVKLHNGFQEKPRILDMCFVKIHNEINLIYIDADNMRIVRRDIAKDELREKKLNLEPNRLAKINNTFIGVIYKKKFDILIFDVINMKDKTTHSITQSDIMKSDSGIQGILALSSSEFILSDKIHLYRCKLEEQRTDVSKFALSTPNFDTARRLTHVTVSRNSTEDVIFVADENDKKLYSIGRENGKYINEHTGHNRGLQNVRAIVATEHRVYAATSAGISVFCHNGGVFAKFENEDHDIADYRMILEYKQHVEHTRGLCMHLDKDYIYIGLSCVIKQNDVICVFRFKQNDTFK